MPPISDDEDSGEEGGKKTGTRRVSTQFIEDKSKRQITFSKRKTGIMKKARELSSLTGADVLLLISSEMGNVYDFSTAKFEGVLTKCKAWCKSRQRDTELNLDDVEEKSGAAAQPPLPNPGSRGKLQARRVGETSDSAALNMMATAALSSPPLETRVRTLRPTQEAQLAGDGRRGRRSDAQSSMVAAEHAGQPWESEHASPFDGASSGGGKRKRLDGIEEEAGGSAPDAVPGGDAFQQPAPHIDQVMQQLWFSLLASQNGGAQGLRGSAGADANGAGAAAPDGAARGGKRQAERSAQQERGKGALFAAIGARAQERAARGGDGIAADAVDPASAPLQSLLSVGSAGAGNAGTGSGAERGNRASV